MTIDWKKIESFVGYGKRDAQVVFIGLEEGLSRSSKLENDLKRRSAFKAIEDVKAAHKGIAGTERLWDEQNPKIQRTWRPMCHLMLAYDERDPREIDRAARVKYQVDELGRAAGNSLLMELLPYPHVNTGHWAYSQFGRFNNRAEYEGALLCERIRRLARRLAQHPRKLVICYGKKAWPHYKHLISRAFVAPINWREVKRNQAVVATVGSTRIVLVHHLSGKRFNTETQLRAFARLALG